LRRCHCKQFQHFPAMAGCFVGYIGNFTMG